MIGAVDVEYPVCARSCPRIGHQSAVDASAVTFGVITKNSDKNKVPIIIVVSGFFIFSPSNK